VDSIPRQVVYAALRTELPFFAIACIALVGGIAGLLLWRLRSRDRLLLWVGLFSVLYAVRLLVENELVRDVFDATGRGYLRWEFAITYAINIPYVTFARELLGQGWKKIIEIWLWLYVAFAAVAMPVALWLGYPPHWMDQLNSLLVVSGTLLLLAQILLSRSSNPMARSLLWPVLAFGGFVLLENQGFRPGGLSIEPLGFLVLLAGLAWIAVRRALATERKLIDVEQELAMARRIQNAILPHAAPELPKLRITTRYQPMTSVAGDFYDFLTAKDNLVTILVADVSGHGVPAALVASMLKVCFAAQAERATDPAAILADLNRMLRGSLGGQYVTAACAAVDTDAGLVRYAGAGHPPALLLQKQSGSVIELAENGLFLGPFPQASYTNLTVPVQSGDALVLYTDGIIEARLPNGEEFGGERLRQLLLSTSGQSSKDFSEMLFGEIASPEQQDDLTLVLVRFG
jgi:sigma-B regulation protein RsbU (phosphoserine phosphatase)